jgi:hypothetical protein
LFLNVLLLNLFFREFSLRLLGMSREIFTHFLPWKASSSYRRLSSLSEKGAVLTVGSSRFLYLRARAKRARAKRAGS